MTHKITFRYRAFLFALVMSFNTSLIVSGTIIYLHTESFAQFIKVWLSSFAIAWPGSGCDLDHRAAGQQTAELVC